VSISCFNTNHPSVTLHQSDVRTEKRDTLKATSYILSHYGFNTDNINVRMCYVYACMY